MGIDLEKFEKNPLPDGQHPLASGAPVTHTPGTCSPHVAAESGAPAHPTAQNGHGNMAPNMARPATPEELRSWLWQHKPRTAEAQFAQMLARWRADPVTCAVEMFRTTLLPYQAQVLLDLFDAPREVYEFYRLDPSFPKRQVVVPSGHGTGKTRVLALALWMHLVLYRFSRTLVTAPTAPQLSGRLWGELRKMRRRIMLGWPQIANEWDVLGLSIVHKNPDYADWCIQGRTARAEAPEGLQGEHALDIDDEFGQIAGLFRDSVERAPSGGMLIAAEEASGIPDEIYQVLDGALSEAGARMIQVGNPTRADGRFAENMDNRARYAVHPLDCRISSSQIVYELPYRDLSGRVHNLKVRGLVEPRQWETFLQECDGDEEHDVFRVRVRGLKPRSNVDQVIRTHWVDAAMARVPDPESARQQAVLGLDFGLSADKHAMAVRRGFVMVDGREWLPPDTPEQITLEAARQAIDAVDTYKVRVIVGDSNGVGRGAMEYLQNYYQEEHPELNVRVVFFNSGKRAANPARYYRRRDEMWYRDGRRWLSDARCTLPPLPGLKSQLTAPGCHEDTTKRIAVESKDEIKKRTGKPSGNLADALLQTLMERDEAIEAPVADAAPKVPPLFQRHFDKLRALAGAGAAIR